MIDGYAEAAEALKGATLILDESTDPRTWTVIVALRAVERWLIEEFDGGPVMEESMEE